jgi:hypothetical protein
MNELIPANEVEEGIDRRHKLDKFDKLASRAAILALMVAAGTSSYIALDTAKKRAEYAIAYPVIDDSLFASGFQDVHNLHVDIDTNTFSFIANIPLVIDGQSIETTEYTTCTGTYNYADFKLSLIPGIECDSESFTITEPENTTVI